MIDRIAMSDLGRFLERQIKELGGMRALARKTNVPHTSLTNIIDGSVDVELSTLVKLSRAFAIPLWRVQEMLGIDLGFSNTTTDQARRLTALLEAMPEYQPIVQELLRFDPDDLRGFLDYLEWQRSRRGS